MGAPEPPSVVPAVVQGGRLIGGCPDARPVAWWSFTKTVLAAAALALVRDGLLALDAPVAGRPWTLRHLLQHRAGVPNYSDLPEYRAAVARGDEPWPVAEMLERTGADRLLFAPEAGWRYSNTGYAIVARLIEEAAGREIRAALHDLALAPLEVAGVALARTPADLVATEWGNATGYHPGWVYHGLLAGPPAAAALWLDGLMAGRLLPPALLAEMRLPHGLGREIPGRPWRDYGYGLGLMIAAEGPAGAAFGHTGQGPPSLAAVYHFPDAAPPRTVAAFAPDDDQAVPEWAVCRLGKADSRQAGRRGG